MGGKGKSIVHPVITRCQNGGENFLYALQDMRLSTSLQAAHEAFAKVAYRFATDAIQSILGRGHLREGSGREAPCPLPRILGLKGIHRETVSSLIGGERLVRGLQRRRREPHVLQRIQEVLPSVLTHGQYRVDREDHKLLFLIPQRLGSEACIYIYISTPSVRQGRCAIFSLSVRLSVRIFCNQMD